MFGVALPVENLTDCCMRNIGYGRAARDPGCQTHPPYATRVTTTRCSCCRAAARSARTRPACSRRSSESGFAPDWVTGVSIGAINAALIAGNPPERRVPRLREFWDRVSSGMPLDRAGRVRSAAPHVQPRVGVGQRDVRRARASSIRAFRRSCSRRRAASLRCPSTTRRRCARRCTSSCEFDRHQRARTMRFAVGAVDVRSGNSVYFDNYKPDDSRHRARARDGERRAAAGFRAGRDRATSSTGTAASSPTRRCGTCSTTARDLEALILQVDLFSARGEMPQNLDAGARAAEGHPVFEQDALQHDARASSSRTCARRCSACSSGCRPICADDPDVRLLADATRGRKVSVVQLINRRFDHSSQAKDYEFSRATVRSLWDAGRDAVRADDGQSRVAARVHGAARRADVRSRALTRRPISTGVRIDEAQGQGRHRHRRGQRARQGHRDALRAGRRRGRDRRPRTSSRPTRSPPRSRRRAGRRSASRWT